jgi:hypothetical protein
MPKTSVGKTQIILQIAKEYNENRYNDKNVFKVMMIKVHNLSLDDFISIPS